MVPAGWVARRVRRKVVAASVAAVAVVAVTGMPQASAAVNPLQALIDAAPDGATIDVPAGFYDGPLDFGGKAIHLDRKSTRLNSSHVKISYAVFCLKKKR